MLQKITVQKKTAQRKTALYGGFDLKKRLTKIMPLYSWVMLATILFVNYFVYFSTRSFTAGFNHYSIVSSLDRNLPFIPFFFSIYLLAYIQWIIGFVLIGRDEQAAPRVFIGELIAKGIALICFVFLPTITAELRPGMEALRGGGIWCELAAWVYSVDAADNCFPSVHCIESWICFRGALSLKKVPRWYAYLMLVMTLLVFASTLFVKQHVLIDVIGGLAAVEIGLFISGRLRLRRLKGEKGGT